MPRPAGPFAIYGSRPPQATLVLPECEFHGSCARNPPPRRHPEVILNSYRLYGRLAISLFVAGALLLLAGCGAISAGSHSGPVIGVGNSSLNFGLVAIGGSKTIIDTITNNTASPVTINAIQGSTAGFQVTGITAPLT